MRFRFDREKFQLGELIKQTCSSARRWFQESQLIDKLITGLPATAVVLVLASLVVFLAANEPYPMNPSDIRSNQSEPLPEISKELRLEDSEYIAWMDMSFYRGNSETGHSVASVDEDTSSAGLTAESTQEPDEQSAESLLNETKDQDDPPEAASDPDHNPAPEDDLALAHESELTSEPEEEALSPTPYPEMTDAQGNPIEGMPVDHFYADDSQFYIRVERANLRRDPNAESDVVEMLTIGMTVQRKGYGLSWSKVETDNGSTGFILSSLLSNEHVAAPTPYPEMTDAQGNPIEGMPVDHFYADNSQFYIQVERANLRQAPNAESEVVAMLTRGMTVQRKGYGMSWSEVETDNGTSGYVLTSLLSKEYVAVPTPAPTPTPVPTAAPTPTPKPTAAPAAETTSSSTSSSQQKIIDLTRSFIGTTYVFGGATPSGFDCSGMVYYTYRHLFGITLPRVASDQARAGQSVSSSNVRPGDILCFDWSRNGRVDHVGIYIGNGKYIHASASRGRVAEGTARFGSDPIVTIRRILN